MDRDLHRNDSKRHRLDSGFGASTSRATANAKDLDDDDFDYTQPAFINIVDQVSKERLGTSISHNPVENERTSGIGGRIDRSSRGSGVTQQSYGDDDNYVYGDDVYRDLDRSVKENEKFKHEYKRIKEEQEIKDGEIKILRTNKQQLERKVLELERSVQTVKQNREKDANLLKVTFENEVESLKTQLAFLARENADLKERTKSSDCANKIRQHLNDVQVRENRPDKQDGVKSDFPNRVTFSNGSPPKSQKRTIDGTFVKSVRHSTETRGHQTVGVSSYVQTDFTLDLLPSRPVQRQCLLSEKLKESKKR